MFRNVMKIWFSMRCIGEFDAIYLQWWDVTFSWCVESIFEVVQMRSLPYRICVSSYVYGTVLGADRFLTDIELMLGSRPSNIWKYSWKFVAPVALLVRVLSKIGGFRAVEPWFQQFGLKAEEICSCQMNRCVV